MMRRTRTGALALFATLFFFYLATSSREWPRGDAESVHSVTQSIVWRGELSTPFRWNVADKSRDGKNYSAFPLAHSLVHVPAEKLRWVIYTKLESPGLANFLMALLANVASAFFGALTCTMFYRLALRLGARAGLALAGTLALAFGTYLWIFSRTPFVEVVHAACYLGLFSTLLAAADRPAWWRGLALGAWAGALINMKLIYVVALPGAAVFLVWANRRSLGRLALCLACAAVTFAPWVGLVAWYNWVRFGSYTSTGYGQDLGPIFATPTWHGLWGVLFSPNKSIFLYAPPLLFSVLVARKFVRGWPRVAAALMLTLGPVLLLCGRISFWAGDWAWGPRYHLFAVPALLLPAVLCAGELRPQGPGAVRALKWAGAGAVLGFALWVQVLGVAFCWDHTYTIGRRVQWNWLGAPNMAHSATGTAYEESAGIVWLLPFNPIAFHAWMMRHVPAGHDWATAQADAPWSHYTKAQFDLSFWWKRIALDWWYPDLRAKLPREATWILSGLLAAWAGSTSLLVRALRAQRRRLPDGAPAGAEV